LSDKSFDHRRAWLLDRLKLLTDTFAIDLCAYALTLDGNYIDGVNRFVAVGHNSAVADNSADFFFKRIRVPEYAPAASVWGTIGGGAGSTGYANPVLERPPVGPYRCRRMGWCFVC
jgi:hypothetical protein